MTDQAQAAAVKPGVWEAIVAWLRVVWVIYWRELRSIFTTIVAYVVIAATLLANGGVFCVLLWALLQPQGIENMNPMEFFLGGNVFFYLILLPGPPLVTMRAFSEEWRSGTLETMLTAPVTDLQLVLAKYLAYLSFFVFMWLPTLTYPLLLEYYGSLDWGPVASGYLGVLMLGALLVAFGVFASALTKHQLLAAILGFSLAFALFIAGILSFLHMGPKWTAFFEFLNMWDHMEELGKGIVDTRRVIFYLTVTATILFVTLRTVQLKRLGS